MKIIGLITEYNPFHNGHIYHINKIKEMYPDSLLILVLNGYFLMRGEISIISKENKTKLALENNVDLVVELPFFFGSNSADIFAESSIYILDKLGCNYLIFGSESNDIDLLTTVAKKQNNKDFNDLVKNYLSEGINYPTALNKAIGIDLNNPNDLLGVSYIKAINKYKSKIKPVTIKRTNDYHDQETDQEIISATNIRAKLSKNNKINKYVPNNVEKYINTINENLLFKLLKYQIVTNDELNTILSVDEGIEKRIKDAALKANSYEELINLIKTKRYTYNRINRMLMHILVGLKKDDKQMYTKPQYIKVLGFNKKGQSYLNTLKKDLNIEVNSKINDNLIKDYELKCAYIYQMLSNENVIEFEIKNKPIKMSSINKE